MNTESETIANLYISYFASGDTMDDTQFIMTAQGCTIIQPVDDEEDTKHIVVMDQCALEVWNKFRDQVLAHKNVRLRPQRGGSWLSYEDWLKESSWPVGSIPNCS